MKTAAFEKFAGLSAILAGMAGFLYSLAFIVIARTAPSAGALLSALFLAVGGLLSLVALSGLYLRVREVDSGFALLALILGVTAAIGSMLHGGYDLANALNPPDVNIPNVANLPSQVDPRGMLTFGVAGLSLIIVIPAALTGFVINPIWYIWLGVALRRKP